MSESELNRFESEVEQARARLTSDLDRLRDPDMVSTFRTDLMREVSGTKDEWVDKAKNATRDGARRVLEDLKDRAAANPLAAAAIGAGVLWHLARHPPITTLLVGVGVFGLMRTNPEQPSAIIDRVGEIAGSVQEHATEWGSDARDASARVGEMASAMSAQIRNQVGERVSLAGEVAQEATASFASGAGELAQRTKRVVDDIVPNGEGRDTLLLGGAMVAIAAAVGIAFQRRNEG
jgi:hypothetical protein